MMVWLGELIVSRCALIASYCSYGAVRRWLMMAVAWAMPTAMATTAATPAAAAAAPRPQRGNRRRAARWRLCWLCAMPRKCKGQPARRGRKPGNKVITV